MDLPLLFRLVRSKRTGEIPRRYLSQEALFSKDPSSILGDHFLILEIARVNQLQYVPRKYLSKEFLVNTQCMDRTLLVWFGFYGRLSSVPRKVLTKSNILARGGLKETLLHHICKKDLRLLPKSWQTKEALSLVDMTQSTPLHRMAQRGFLHQIDAKILDSQTLLMEDWSGQTVIDRYAQYHFFDSKNKKKSRRYLSFLLERLPLKSLEDFVGARGFDCFGQSYPNKGWIVPGKVFSKIVGKVLAWKRDEAKRDLKKRMVLDKPCLELVF